MLFGSYCRVHEENAPRNSMAARTQGTLSLGPSGNIQGAHKFYSLTTGKVITRRAWTLLLMLPGVIERVNTLAQGQPSLLLF